MKPVITYTPNPCIDINSSVPEIVPEKKLRCSHITKEPGGGGINVSRIISRFGGNTQAVYLAGGYTGKLFSAMLKKENVAIDEITTACETRENFIVKEESTNKQFRFGMPGQHIAESEWKESLNRLQQINEASFIIASGSLPEGVPQDLFAKAAIIASQKNIPFIADTSGEALKEVLNAGAYMLKPNLGELASLNNKKEITINEAVADARKIIDAGKCKVLVISAGAEGAVFVTHDLVKQIRSPKVEIKSTVGAGDSMVAGIALKMAQGSSLPEAVQYGIACGTATTMHEGTSLCNKEDADALFEIIKAGEM